MRTSNGIEVNEVNNIDPRKAEAARRKTHPMYSGLMKYFPDALDEVSHVSYVGNEQHNPGQPLHWAKEKSTDEPDCILRHLKDHASGEKYDTDGLRHLAKVAWRALAFLQRQIDQEKEIRKDAEAASIEGKTHVPWANRR